MKKIMEDPFREYRSGLSQEEETALAAFFQDFEGHCLIAKDWKKKLRKDFEQALLYYHAQGLPLARALERLDPKKLGGFYARPAALWFPLDNAAKVYPLSMDRGKMAVFRLSAYLKAPVVPQLLQIALTFTIKRFPSFATTLKKGFFWHYLDTAKRRFTVQQERDIPCQPLKVGASGSQSFRVLYWNNRISVEFFHVLTDGVGGLEFLKVLIGEYLRLQGVDFIPDGNIMDVWETPATEEMENAFRKVPRSKTASGFVDKPVLQMTGRLSQAKPCRILHLKMNADALYKTAKGYGVSVTEYVLGIMFLATRAATDAVQGELGIQVPVNMRKFYPTRSLRNFSMYCGVRFPVEAVESLPQLLPQIRQQLVEKADQESMRQMATATEKMVSAVRYIPLAVKQPVAKAIYGFLGDKIFGNTLSNLGVVSMPEALLPHIESMDFVLGPDITNRAECTLITVAGTATFSISKMTEDPTFEEEMVRLLNKDGLSVTAEGSAVYDY